MLWLFILMLNVKKGQLEVIDVGCELERGMKVRDVIYKIILFLATTLSSSDYVTNVALVQLRYKARVRGADRFFYVSDKQTRVIGPHSTAHSNSTNLAVVLAIKGKGIEGQYRTGIDPIRWGRQ